MTTGYEWIFVAGFGAVPLPRRPTRLGPLTKRRTHPGRASRGRTVQSPRTGSGTKLPSSERGCRPPTDVPDTPKRHETTPNLTMREIFGSPARGHTPLPTTHSGKVGVR